MQTVNFGESSPKGTPEIRTIPRYRCHLGKGRDPDVAVRENLQVS